MASASPARPILRTSEPADASRVLAEVLAICPFPRLRGELISTARTVIKASRDFLAAYSRTDMKRGVSQSGWRAILEHACERNHVGGDFKQDRSRRRSAEILTAAVRV